MSDDSHPILTLVGLVAVGVGVLMVIRPGLAATIGTDYAAVTVVGLLALAQGLRVARARKAAELRAAETPDVETVETMPTPGDSFDRQVAELRSGPRRSVIRKRANLRETLEAAAVTAVADRENCTRERARERIEAGTWTDDVHAAAFLGGTEAPTPPLLDRVKIAASTESAHQFRVRRTADAIAQVAGIADEGGTDEGGTDEDVTDDGSQDSESGTSQQGEAETHAGDSSPEVEA